jgi:hypothetical protein
MGRVVPTRCRIRHGRWTSDVTDDRSHHRIGAIFGQTIPGMKCLGGIPRRMPYLGAETALGCVGGRQVAILPLSLATAAQHAVP